MSFCLVSHYHNKKDTKKLGKRIETLRLQKNLSMEDIAFMTGFAKATIMAVENGANTDSSHLIEIAKAIGVHPMELFNLPFDIKPRYKLSPNRQDRDQLTFRLNKLHAETDFFENPRFVNDIGEYLSEEYNIQPDASSVSVILARMVKEGKLSYTKIGRRNYYSKPKPGGKLKGK